MYNFFLFIPEDLSSFHSFVLQGHKVVMSFKRGGSGVGPDA